MVHRVSVLLLYDADVKFLLQHRTEDAWILPGYWAFFGGGIKKGETPEDAVRREAFEELNYNLKNPILATEQNFKEGAINGQMYVYVEAFYENKAILKLQEGQGWGWFRVSEIEKLKMVERDRDMITAVAHRLDSRQIEPVQKKKPTSG